MKEILALVEKMSPDELEGLIELAQRKLQQIAPLQPVTESERGMLEPRVEEALRNPLGSRSWSQVKTSLLEQMGEAA